MKIYVASSWRNESQPAVVEFLRRHGHEVYDFRHPVPGNEGFSWKQVGLERDEQGKSTLLQLKAAHEHEVAEQGFKYDFDAMKGADACVLVLPCGNSAHLEAGWMQGQGKLTLVYCDGSRKIEPELMYKFLDGGMFISLEQLVATLPSPILRHGWKIGDKIKIVGPHGSYGRLTGEHPAVEHFYAEYIYGLDVHGNPMTARSGGLKLGEFERVSEEDYARVATREGFGSST